MTRSLLTLWVLLVTTFACEGEDMSKTFWDHFRADQLGSTHRVLPGPNLGDNGESTREKCIDLKVDDRYAASMIVGIRAEYRVDAATVSQIPGPGGTLVGPVPGTGAPSGRGFPLVGRVEWGVGGARNVVDFDIPVVRVVSANSLPPGQQAITDPGNGVQLYIGGASGIVVSVRNDSNLTPVSTMIGGNAVDRVGNAEPAYVKTYIAPAASRGGSPLQRSIVLAGGNVLNQPIPAGSFVTIDIPAFAKRVRFPRFQIDTAPLRIGIHNLGFNERRVFIPINNDGPIELDPNTEATIDVLNQGAVAITNMKAVFDVDPI